jgi:hypothetical protein
MAYPILGTPDDITPRIIFVSSKFKWWGRTFYRQYRSKASFIISDGTKKA